MRNLLVLALVAGAAASANAQVTPQGDLTNGLPQVGTVTGGTINFPDQSFWSYWTFSANAGDAITIDVDRISGDLDPASSVVFGDATGLAFASLTGTSIFDWSGPGLSANLAQGDDETGPAVPGPFGDPQYGFVAANAGVHTIAVASFASQGQPPYDYSIVVRGSTAPAPGALALVGLGGLVAARRRRA